MWKHYHIIETTEELTELLAKQSGLTKIISGGTDLMVEINSDKWPELDTVLDISRVIALDKIWQDKDDMLHIGAIVTHNDVLHSRLLRDGAFPLVQACYTVGTPTLRNRATVVGNICNASPGADLPPALLVFDTVVNIVGLNGSRQVKLHEFFTGVKRTVLQPGELVVSITIPEPEPGEKSTYLRQARLRGHDLATVGVASRLKPDGKVALGICAVAPTPLRLFALEDQISQRGLSEETAVWAAQEIKNHIRPITDVRSSAAYRLHMASVLLKRGLLKLLGKEG